MKTVGGVIDVSSSVASPSTSPALLVPATLPSESIRQDWGIRPKPYETKPKTLTYMSININKIESLTKAPL